MGRIDRETVQRVLDTADIVDVVSDFVSLKKKGANYMGLCPFHAERTPSFSVSKSRNICKCFSCGKGGSPVGFIMELENMSYTEAIRYLARKYNIEIKEEELTDEQKNAEAERESLYAVTEWCSNYYSRVIFEDTRGRNIGLKYFEERGLNEQTIKDYRLGYSLDFYTMPKEALKAGYTEKYLIESGQCYKRDSTGKLADRFGGRVIYPIFSASGKIVGFGGRTLTTSKEVAKYVNTPETPIYVKNKELYGLYQAKKAIIQKECCYLVEGYMDVLSMAQSGVQNVVASSGTSLTEGQVRLLHRFTQKVILIYDSDAAGIKAAIRGVDMLLAEGLDVSIVLLPDGDDPDSFAQRLSSSEVEEYISTYAEDFIKFKTRILLGDAHNDPIARTKVIEQIIESISVIPNEIKRLVYCQECSRLLNMKEDVLVRQVSKLFNKRATDIAGKKLRDKTHRDIDNESVVLPDKEPETPDANSGNTPTADIARGYERMRRCEEEVLKYIVRYAFLDVFEAIDEEGNQFPMNVLEFLVSEVDREGMRFSHSTHVKLYTTALDEQKNWTLDSAKFRQQLEERRLQMMDEGFIKIREKASDLNDINRMEEELHANVDNEINEAWQSYATGYFCKKILSAEDSQLRDIAIRLVADKHQLSRYHSRFNTLQSEKDRLQELLGTAMNSWKYALLETKIDEVVFEISEAARKNDLEAIQHLMKTKLALDKQQAQFAHILGERVFGG